MSEEITENLVELNLNSVLAAIVKMMGVVAIPVEDVIASYEDQSLSITFDDETRMIVLALVNSSELEMENTDES
jgi:hypothetical protein